MDKTVIEIKNLSKEIDGQTILKDINLDIKEGHIYGITGRNGSGKSMLLKTMIGLIIPTSGQIKINNTILNKGDIPSNIGILINSPGLLLQCSAFQNLKILASIKNIISDDDIKKALNSVGLNPDDKRAVKKYSLGMKQKVGIAQAIMENPNILILDEPMNALDENSIQNLRELILELKKDKKTIILTSHNKDDIEKLCDYVYHMSDGKIENVNPYKN